jgi:hypothetical protein
LGVVHGNTGGVVTTMRMFCSKALGGLVVTTVCMVLAPAASASITPAVTLNQSAGNHAGSSVNLGMDLTFSPGADSPKDMTLNLPPGLLANAAIDGGACLSSSTPSPACQVGTGTVRAQPVLPLNIVGPTVSVSVTFDLVAPPAPGDLAGLVIMATNPITHAVAQLGSPGQLTVNPAGAVSIVFHNIPNSYALVGPVAAQIAVDEITSTFNRLRLPTRCPSPAARFAVSADSYSDAATKTASAPLQVTGCSSLPFSPLLGVTAVRDGGDSGVAITTDVTQTAGQATSRTVALGFPSAVVAPNAGAVISGGLFCTDPSFASCKTIGSSTAKSPLYPKALTGKVYLTGTLSSPAITVSFPPPFALTLNGSVSLAGNTTTFSGVPDLPLSDLTVSLAGGPDAAFASTCTTPSGDAIGGFSSQDGDLFASSTAPFTVTGCPPASPEGSGGGATPPSTRPAAPVTAPLGLPSLAAASLTGLRHGKPAIGFRLITGKGAPKLSSLTVPLPRGLSFIRRRVRRRLVIQGVTIRNARVKSLSLKRGRLTITLRRPSGAALVRFSSRALHETAGLRRKARRGHVHYLKLTVAVTTTAHRHVTLTRAMKPRG